MTATTFTGDERGLILKYAAEMGDRSASVVFQVPEATIRSWRHRADRKVTDRRVRDGDAAGNDQSTGSASSMIADDLAHVQVPTDEWNPALGCAVKVPARARVIERFEVGGQFMSQGELRELRAPGTASLAVGDVVLLGGEHVEQFSDALWCVAERQDGKVMVRPACVRRDEKLSDDRSRIVAKGPEDKPPGYVSPEQRAQWQNEQIDDQDRRMRQVRELLTRPIT